jgi:hypothetical protein
MVVCYALSNDAPDEAAAAPLGPLTVAMEILPMR